MESQLPQGKRRFSAVFLVVIRLVMAPFVVHLSVNDLAVLFFPVRLIPSHLVAVHVGGIGQEDPFFTHGDRSWGPYELVYKNCDVVHAGEDTPRAGGEPQDEAEEGEETDEET